MASLISRYDSLVLGAGRDPKQAMRECEKKSKKNPNDPALHLLKAHLHFRQRQYPQGREICKSLSAMRPVITDINFIKAVYELVYRLEHSQGMFPANADSAIRALWNNLIKDGGGKRKKQLLVQYFRTSCAWCLWEDSIQALMQLRRISPEESRLYFLQILLRQIVASTYKYRSRELISTLERVAFNMLMQAVDQEVQPVSAHIPKIKSTEEIRLFFQVLRAQKQYSVMFNHYHLAQPIETNADFRFLIPEIKAAQGRWEELHAFLDAHIRAIVEKIRVNDGQGLVGFAAVDWKLWEYYAMSIANADSNWMSKEKVQEPIAMLLEIVGNVRPGSSVGRSAYMAAMMCAMRWQRMTPFNPNPGSPQSLFELLDTYSALHLHQVYFFNDIRKFIEALPYADAVLLSRRWRAGMRRIVPRDDDSEEARVKWLNAELNALKVDFLLFSTIKVPPRDTFRAFACTALQFARTARLMEVKDRFPEEEAYLLVVSALEKTYHLTVRTNLDHSEDFSSRQVPLMQAVMLLQYALSRNVHNYKARICLVKLSRKLGLMSIAMDSYQKLGIREIQHDTLSHLLFRGISVTHPFGVARPGNLKLDPSISDPYHGFKKVINWYDGAVERINMFVAADIDKLRLDKVEEFVRLKYSLDTSLNKNLSLFERRRIARLTDRQYDEIDLLDIQNTQNWSDQLTETRDFDVYPEFHCTGDPDAYKPEGINREYMANLVLLDELQSALTAKDSLLEYSLSNLASIRASSFFPTVHANDAEETERAPSAVADEFEATSIQDCESFYFSSSFGYVICKVLEESKREDETPTLGLNDALHGFEASSYINRLKPRIPDAYFEELPVSGMLSRQYRKLETLKMLTKLLDLMVLQSKNKTHKWLYQKLDPKHVANIKEKYQQMTAETREDVNKWKSRLEKDFTSTMLTKVFGNACGPDLENLVGRQFAESRMTEWRESALDSLDGLLKVKVP